MGLLTTSSMTTEVPKYGRMAPQVVASHEPYAIDAYHDAVADALGADTFPRSKPA